MKIGKMNMTLWVDSRTFPNGEKIQSIGKSMWVPAPGGGRNIKIDLYRLGGNGVNLNAPREAGDALLHQAVILDKLDVAIALIEAGADVNIKNPRHLTPLHVASCLGKADLMKLLLTNKADVDARAKGGVTPLQLAVFNHNDAGIAEILIRHGADVCEKTEHDSVLHSAVKNAEALKLILTEIKKKLHGKKDQLKSVMNVADTEGDTPLMWAMELGNVESAKLLINCKEIDVNKQNVNGWTALHWAADGGHLEIVKALLDKKANAKIKDKKRETAFDLAKGKINEDEKYKIIADLLLKATNGGCFGRFW